MTGWLETHPYVLVVIPAIVAVLVLAVESYTRGRLGDHELQALRQMKREARNRGCMHHGRLHDERTSEDHR